MKEEIHCVVRRVIHCHFWTNRGNGWINGCKKE